VHVLNYRVSTLSPVLISSFGDANMTRTMDYIPGHVLLGAFAARYISRKKGLNDAHRDETFYKWFLRGEITFTNAYFLLSDDGKDITMYPTPLSIQGDKGEEKIYNLAVLEDEVTEPTAALGYYCHFKDSTIIVDAPEKQLSFHHWRGDRLKGNSSDGGIFYYEALAQGQVFAGAIYGEQVQLERFKEIFGDKFPIQIGRSKNTQYGQAEIELSEVREYSPFINLESENLEDNEVLLTFTSPVILLNKYGYPETSQRVLEEYMRDVFGEHEFHIEQAFVRTEDIEGHVSVWKLKKPLEKAFISGTTFKVVFSERIGQELEDKLCYLLVNGLGERRNEGFGRVVINWATQETYHKRGELKDAKPEKPNMPPPELIKTIFTSIVSDNITRFVINEAVQQAKQYNNREQVTSSLLGRLEIMLKDSPGASNFVEKVGRIRKTAQDKLKRCRNESQTLWDVLNNKGEPNWEKMFSKMDNIRELEKVAGEVGFEFKQDGDFIEDLYKNYWQTFFRTLRKLNKEGGRADG